MIRASRASGRVIPLLFAAVFGVGRSAIAQVITGRITGKGDGASVTGAVVALVDSLGHVVTTGFADDSGRFALNATTPGRFAVRVERVGFRSTVSALTLVRQGETVDLPIAIASAGISLKAMRVSADRRCVVRPQEGLAAAQLWEEARKALNATQLTQLAQAAAKARRDPHRFTVRIRKFTRELHPQTLAPLSDEGYEVEAEMITPFVAASPEVLARDGYIVGELEKGRMYYAPDASILLSDQFLDTHCFRLQEPNRDKRDVLIGLAFEPVRSARMTSEGDRALVDVHGVLWLDRASAELRYMDFAYSNLSAEERDSRAGGQIEFRPLPDGRWAVWRWYIRMPRYERRVILGDGIRPSESRLELVKLREEGAEILTVMAPGTGRPHVATLRGTVVDSLRGKPMAGVRVFLSGTVFAAVTDSSGRYVMDSVPPGRYTASVITPRIDSLLLEPPSRELTLSSDEEKELDFALPSFKTLTAKLCSGTAVAAADSLSLILGLVRDTASTLAPGATIRAEWTAVSRAAGDQLRVQPITNETTSAQGGRYALCGLPPETRLTIRARQGQQAVTTHASPAVRGEVRRLDLTLRRP